MNLYKRHLCVVAAACAMLTASAQNDGQKTLTVTGSIQSDILIPQEDDKIGTGEYSDWGLTNTYVDVNVMSKYSENEYFEARARVEYLDHPLRDSTATSRDGDSETLTWDLQ